MEDLNLEMARRIAIAVQAAGGRTFFVGGYVRDSVMGIPCKDIDIEVHGVTPETLEAILDSLGERTTMGMSFGIYGLRHFDLDIAMPRMEKATGRGHRDFAVFVDPFLGAKKAAKRRDFTINALMQDVLTGEIVDCYGGLSDLSAGILRHVSDETFAEDPLRVLRAAQFAARFGFSIAPETLRLMAGMELSALAGERVMGETKKALLKAEKPSVYFETLRQVNQLAFWFPELSALIGVNQEPKYHPEGDVWNHTMLVLDEAAKLRKNAKEPLAFMLAALTHDYGKAECTKTIDGRIRAFGHEEAGVPLAARALSRMTSEIKLSRYVQNMVLLHMRPNALFAMGSGAKAAMRLLDESVCPADLLLLAEADHCGRTGDWREAYAPCRAWLRARLAEYDALMALPQVRGADLIQAGMQPGMQMKDALAYAHRLHLSGVTKENALKQTLAYIRQKNGKTKK